MNFRFKLIRKAAESANTQGNLKLVASCSVAEQRIDSLNQTNVQRFRGLKLIESESCVKIGIKQVGGEKTT